MVDLDDGESIDILGSLDLLGCWQSCFLKDPIVVPFVTAFLGSEEVSASDKGHLEVVLDSVDSAVGYEGPVGDEQYPVVRGVGFEPTNCSVTTRAPKSRHGDLQSPALAACIPSYIYLYLKLSAKFDFT